MKEQTVTINDIGNDLYYADLDSEYRESLAHSIMLLGYVSDSPLNLYCGTTKQKKEIENFERSALDSNQISEIIHLMMYEMRDDFQYGKFKPIALKFLDIVQKTNSVNQPNKVKIRPQCNIHEAFGTMIKIIGLASKTLKKNNMIAESREMVERATKTYSYDEALDVINEYVETIDRNIKKTKMKLKKSGEMMSDMSEGKEQERNKPKCPLIGADGNIFSLMGIASKTLKRNGMQEESKEMCDRITKSGSYESALNIISDYVEIVSQEELEEEEV